MGLISLLSTAPKIVQVSCSTVLEPKAGFVFVDASKQHIDLTLPDADASNNFLVIVAMDNSLGITLKVPGCSKFLDNSNIAFNTTGDAMVFVSNRLDTWCCVGRYTSHLNY